MSVKYGNRKNKGYKPEKFARGSTNVIRKILQQLESGKLIKHQEKDVHKGRVLTPLGLKLITECSKEALKNPPVKAAKKVLVHEKPLQPAVQKDNRKERPAKQNKE